MGTRELILNILRRKKLTIADLCKEIGVSRTAVNLQIKQLEAEGLIRQYIQEHCGKVGKPAVFYESMPGSEDYYSKGYPVLLSSLLVILRERLGEEALISILDKTGRLMAKNAKLDNPNSFEEGLKNAMSAADSIGATTEALLLDGGVLVRNYSCPMGAAVRTDVCVCRALAAFFSEATNSDVSEQCIRDNHLICQYMINHPTHRPIG